MQTSMIEKSLTNTYISTGNYLLDTTLSNGFPTGSINVIYEKSNIGTNWVRIRLNRINKINSILKQLK